MFTSNTDQQRFEDYCEKYEDAKCVKFEIFPDESEESKIEITWELNNKQWSDTKYILSEDIAEMDDQEIIEYIEENLVD